MSLCVCKTKRTHVSTHITLSDTTPVLARPVSTPAANAAKQRHAPAPARPYSHACILRVYTATSPTLPTYKPVGEPEMMVEGRIVMPVGSVSVKPGGVVVAYVPVFRLR